jgi:nucleotide-binding universal stress UspA family protein
MTLAQRVSATTGEWAQAHKPIVVAVDGSERNKSAVTWASAEAAADGCEVVLVTAIDDHLLPAPHFSIRSQEQSALDMLGDIRNEVRHIVDQQVVATEVVTGSTVDVLLDRSKDARMLVVGKRGLGGFARVIVGSTSIAVAGRAKVPVTIVPDTWKHATHVDAPIVLGIDPYRPEKHPIRLAFRRAERLDVRLVAVHGWEAPTAYTLDAAAVTAMASQWEQEANTEFDRVLDVWRERFPDVEVQAVHSHSHPAMAVLDAAEKAQLVVLGRHTDGRLGGFAFGSVTRAVLHYAECPVMVVPTDGS